MRYLGINCIIFICAFLFSCTQYENNKQLEIKTKNLYYKIVIPDSMNIEKKWENPFGAYLLLLSNDKTEKFVLFIEILDGTRDTKSIKSEFLPIPMCLDTKSNLKDKLLNDKSIINVVEFSEKENSNLEFTSIKTNNRYNKSYCQASHCNNKFRIILDGYNEKNTNRNSYFTKFDKFFNSLKVEIQNQ